jgi:hypothetical protein
LAVHGDHGVRQRVGRSDRLDTSSIDDGNLAVMAAASAWDVVDHAVAPVLAHPAYPWIFAGLFVVSATMAWNLLRHLRPNAQELAREMVALGTHAPSSAVIQAAVSDGIKAALHSFAEEVRRDISALDRRVLILETRADTRWDGRDRRRLP